MSQISVSESVSYFTVSRGGTNLNRGRTHARTGPDTQRAQAHNHKQNSPEMRKQQPTNVPQTNLSRVSQSGVVLRRSVVRRSTADPSVYLPRNCVLCFWKVGLRLAVEDYFMPRVRAFLRSAPGSRVRSGSASDLCDVCAWVPCGRSHRDPGAAPRLERVDSFRKLSHRKKEDLNAHVALGTFYSEERAESATAMTEAVKVNGDCGLTAAGATSATLAHMTLARQRKDAFVRDACSRATSCTPAGWRTQAAARTRTAT